MDLSNEDPFSKGGQKEVQTVSNMSSSHVMWLPQTAGCTSSSIVVYMQQQSSAYIVKALTVQDYDCNPD